MFALKWCIISYFTGRAQRKLIEKAPGSSISGDKGYNVAANIIFLEVDDMLHLPDLSKQGQQTDRVTIDTRLPQFISGPCQLTVTYEVTAEDDYFLLRMNVSGPIQCICQRCMQEYSYDYDNTTLLALCLTEERAEQLLDQYESIVVPQNQVKLSELVTDELHLYAPEFHPDEEDCKGEVMQILSVKGE